MSIKGSVLVSVEAIQTKKPDYLFPGNPAIRLRRTRDFPSPDHSGFGFVYVNIGLACLPRPSEVGQTKSLMEIKQHQEHTT
jgi:hypothetical protein